MAVPLSFPWEESGIDAPPPHERRVVANAKDRVAWIRARSRGVTATDAAKLTSEHAVRAAARDKMFGARFTGNAYTEHGKRREPAIAAWMATAHGIEPSSTLFHARDRKLHLATPDGIAVRATGELVLAEIKTTKHLWKAIPRNYLRQVWWQQYVLGAERTLVVWERHDEFVPVGEEPECRWIDRDDNEIHRLVRLADLMLDELHGRR